MRPIRTAWPSTAISWGVSKFVMDGHKITGLDTQGKKVFSHTYRKLDKEK